MPRFITHVAAQNERILREGLRFVLNMPDHLDTLPTLEDLRKDTIPLPEAHIESDVTFTQKERYTIAATIGEAKQAGVSVNYDEIVQHWEETFKKKDASERERERVVSWIDLVDHNPADAALHLYHQEHLTPAYIVIRELPTADPSDAMLLQFIHREKPKLLSYLDNLPVYRELLAVMYQDFARQFHLGRMQATTKLSLLQRQFTARLRSMLGATFTGDQSHLYRAVTIGMRLKLDVPRGQPMADGSQWDRAECHVMLTRDEVRKEILGFAVHYLDPQGRLSDACRCFSCDEAGIDRDR